MMNAQVPIEDRNHEDIRAWLERALRGQEPLPRLTPDESLYLGILRLEKGWERAARDSLRDGCLQLVRQFCAEGRGQTSYVEELLALASAFKNPELVEILADLANRFLELPDVPTAVRLAVLAALVDTPPPRGRDFWQTMLAQDPAKYAGLALSGVLATNPEAAVAMLPSFPDSERLGQAAALKLDLTWDNLASRERFQFVREIRATLRRCGRHFAGPVQAWTDSKRLTPIVDVNSTMVAGIRGILGVESTARTRSARLSLCCDA